jgi:hypothetical protein
MDMREQTNAFAWLELSTSYLLIYREGFLCVTVKRFVPTTVAPSLSQVKKVHFGIHKLWFEQWKSGQMIILLWDGLLDPKLQIRTVSHL